MERIFVGCAGWSLRKELADAFPSAGTHLQRYAARLGAVEINSSFYRSHRHATYARWATSTPAGFRFAVKLPKQITHLNRLADAEAHIDQFAAETSGLGDKLGVVLVQLPPSLALDRSVAEPFFHHLRGRITAAISCEPRHRSWFQPAADALLESLKIGRVAADPSVVPAAAEPGGHRQVVYYRWHGSPRMYYSSYEEDALRGLRSRLLEANENADQVWCIFDNTAEGDAQRNALRLLELLNSV